MDTHENLERDLAYLGNNVARLNELWNIEDRPITSGGSIFGKIAVFIKRCIRKAVYWLIRPYWDQQVEFNQVLCAAMGDAFRIQSALANQPQLGAPPYDPLADAEGTRVIQLVSTLNFGDAVGNEVIAFKRILRKAGFTTEIYANEIAKRIKPGTARLYRDMPELRPEDLVIYHLASECPISKDIGKFPCRVILRYHNITPPEFFHGFDANAEKATTNGLKQVKSIRNDIYRCLPVSDFNRRDLERLGYTCPMEVMPILLQMDDYAKTPDPEVVRKYSDGVTNILFVGRMAPNKKVEDVISCFAAYKERVDRKARLILVGSFQETDQYYKFLQKHIRALGVEDVIFPGHISFAEILAYYTVADVFLCMSEHEGFCVPLVESMYFKVPIVAYDSSAIADTLHGCGILLEDKNPAAAAQAISQAIRDRERYAGLEAERLHELDRERIGGIFLDFVRRMTAVDGETPRETKLTIQGVSK